MAPLEIAVPLSQAQRAAGYTKVRVMFSKNNLAVAKRLPENEQIN